MLGLWLTDGRIMVFKAQFCARGDKQFKGIDFYETYALVVQWTTMATDHLGEEILNQVRMFMLKCLRVSHSKL